MSNVDVIKMPHKGQMTYACKWSVLKHHKYVYQASTSHDLCRGDRWRGEGVLVSSSPLHRCTHKMYISDIDRMTE